MAQKVKGLLEHDGRTKNTLTDSHHLLPIPCSVTAQVVMTVNKSYAVTFDRRRSLVVNGGPTSVLEKIKRVYKTLVGQENHRATFRFIRQGVEMSRFYRYDNDHKVVLVPRCTFTCECAGSEYPRVEFLLEQFKRCTVVVLGKIQPQSVVCCA